MTRFQITSNQTGTDFIVAPEKKGAVQGKTYFGKSVRLGEVLLNKNSLIKRLNKLIDENPNCGIKKLKEGWFFGFGGTGKVRIKDVAKQLILKSTENSNKPKETTEPSKDSTPLSTPEESNPPSTPKEPNPPSNEIFPVKDDVVPEAKNGFSALLIAGSDPYSKFLVGRAYHIGGNLIEKNEAKGLKILRQLAKEGQPDAQLYLKDLEPTPAPHYPHLQALINDAQSDNEFSAQAQYLLGIHYFKEREIEKGIDFMRKSEWNGDSKAHILFDLCLLISKSKFSIDLLDLHEKEGLVSKYQLALHYFIVGDKNRAHELINKHIKDASFENDRIRGANFLNFMKDFEGIDILTIATKLPDENR